MAYAQRKIWLEPEEQQAPVVLQPRPQRRRRAAPAAPQRPLKTMLMTLVGVAVVVSLATAFIGTYAHMAQTSFRRQTLQQEYGQLNRDCIQLKLEIDHLAAQPRLTQVALAQGLEQPDPQRLHCVRVTSDPQWSVLARTAPAPQKLSWLARSQRQLVATLGNALQRLGRGPGVPAYAQQ
jgi:hypothetical protein